MTKRISSGGTFFFKFVVPAVFILPASLILMFAAPLEGLGVTLYVCVWLTAVTWAFRRSYMRLKLISVDDSALHVSNYFKTITVPLSEVLSVEKRDWGRGYRVWAIRLRNETEFGKEIIFTPVQDHTLPDKASAEDLKSKIPAW